MKRFLILIFVLGLFSSCNSEMSLQKYFALKSAEDGFMAVTVPSSLIQLKESESTEENIKALKSFKRLNVLILRDSEGSKINKQEEIDTINRILSNESYRELMEINYQGQAGSLKYSGQDDDIKEIIGFGYNDEIMVLLRITGDNMTVKQLVKLVSSIDFDKSNLDQLNNLI